MADENSKNSEKIEESAERQTGNLYLDTTSCLSSVSVDQNPIPDSTSIENPYSFLTVDNEGVFIQNSKDLDLDKFNAINFVDPGFQNQSKYSNLFSNKNYLLHENTDGLSDIKNELNKDNDVISKELKVVFPSVRNSSLETTKSDFEYSSLDNQSVSSDDDKTVFINSRSTPFLEKSENNVIKKKSFLQTNNLTSVLPLPILNLNINLSPVKNTTSGFGVNMVSNSSCQMIIYRSVPPEPSNYSLNDGLHTRSNKIRSKTAPVSTNTPQEYAQRFKSRPTTKPRIIQFDGSNVLRTRPSMLSTAFPSTRSRVYMGNPLTRPTSVTEIQMFRRNTDSSFQVSGKGQLDAQLHSTSSVDAKRSASVNSRFSSNTDRRTCRVTPISSVKSPRPSPALLKGDYNEAKLKEETHVSITTTNEIPQPADGVLSPEALVAWSQDYYDYTALPRPKKVLPKRELPWVFRYKVKRGMNTLSRIMASKSGCSTNRTYSLS